MTRDNYAAKYRAAIERLVSEQQENCRKAGHPIDRARAIALVLDDQVQGLKRNAERLRHFGDIDDADDQLSIARLIPELFVALGFR